MKKIAGIVLSAALLLAFMACHSGVPQGAYVEADELIIADDDGVFEDLIDDNPPSDEPAGIFSGLESGERYGEITHVVIHFMSNVIENRVNPYILADIERIFLDYGLSAHYIIDRDGIVYFAVPEDRVAFHAGVGTLADFPAYEDNLNQHSIGIELLGIGTREEMSPFLTAYEYDALDPSLIGFTEAQYEALNWLLNSILARHPGVLPNRTHIIGHSEYAPYKTDPGELFEWERLDFMNRP